MLKKQFPPMMIISMSKFDTVNLMPRPCAVPLTPAPQLHLHMCTGLETLRGLWSCRTVSGGWHIEIMGFWIERLN